MAKVKARVLTDGIHGKAGDVALVEGAIASNDTDLDPHPDAVAYAEKVLKARKTMAEAVAAAAE